VQIEHLLFESRKYPDSHDVHVFELEHVRQAYMLDLQPIHF